MFSSIKFFEHNITYHNLIKLKYNDLIHANNVIFINVIFWLILRCNMVINPLSANFTK